MKVEKKGPNSQANSTNSELGLNKINSENFSNFGNKDLRGSIIQGHNSSGLALRDVYAEDYLEHGSIGKPIERVMADTVSSNFTRKLKDKKVSDMQTVEI